MLLTWFRPALALIVCTLGVEGPVRASGDIIYVRADALGANDGTSWPDAFTDLQDALDTARARLPEPTEIWVAQGVYKPDRGTGNKYLSFDLPDGVAVFGGFVGTDEKIGDRNPDLFQTVLSGDLLDNDDFSELTDHPCCHGDDGKGTGCPDDGCRQMVCASSDPCCSIGPTGWTSQCGRLAGQFCCPLCRPTRCDNSQRVVSANGEGAAVLLDGVTIADGEQTLDPDAGDATASGAGLETFLKVKLSRCVFLHNRAMGGAAIFGGVESVDLDRCLVVQNESTGGTGVVFVLGGTITMQETMVRDNLGDGMTVFSSGRIGDCGFVRNAGTGLTILRDGLNVIGCLFQENDTMGYGGGARNFGFTQIGNCTFVGNTSSFAGGGLYSSALSPVVVVSCLFTGNRAGGGVLYPGAPISEGAGGAIAAGFGDVFILNSTIVGNYAGEVGGVSLGPGRVANSILWGNQDTTGMGEEAQIGLPIFDPAPELQFNVIQGWTGTLDGTGMLDIDPGFVDALGEDGIVGTLDDDFHLRADSPLINAGEVNPPLMPNRDFDNHPRPLCGRVDIGAFEFGFGDYDCDRIVTLGDFAEWPGCDTSPGSGNYVRLGCVAFDSDADGDVDLEDFAGACNALSRTR